MAASEAQRRAGAGWCVMHLSWLEASRAAGVMVALLVALAISSHSSAVDVVSVGVTWAWPLATKHSLEHRLPEVAM